MLAVKVNHQITWDFLWFTNEKMLVVFALLLPLSERPWGGVRLCQAVGETSQRDAH